MSNKWYARPVLFVSGVDDSIAFYTAKLGFKEAWRYEQHGAVSVAQVDRAGCELILSSHDRNRIGTGMIFISLDPDVLDAALAAFGEAGVEVEDGWWGYPVKIVRDPDGNELYFPREG